MTTSSRWVISFWFDAFSFPRMFKVTMIQSTLQRVSLGVTILIVRGNGTLQDLVILVQCGNVVEVSLRVSHTIIDTNIPEELNV
jgi:hypothetical protein